MLMATLLVFILIPNWEQPRTFHCYDLATSQWQSKQNEMDALNGFGFPLSLQETFPKYQPVIHDGELQVLSFKDKKPLASIYENHFCRVVVQPNSLGTHFVTANLAGEVIYWEIGT